MWKSGCNSSYLAEFDGFLRANLAIRGHMWKFGGNSCYLAEFDGF